MIKKISLEEGSLNEPGGASKSNKVEGYTGDLVDGKRHGYPLHRRPSSIASDAPSKMHKPRMASCSVRAMVSVMRGDRV